MSGMQSVCQHLLTISLIFIYCQPFCICRFYIHCIFRVALSPHSMKFRVWVPGKAICGSLSRMCTFSPCLHGSPLGTPVFSNSVSLCTLQQITDLFKCICLLCSTVILNSIEVVVKLVDWWMDLYNFGRLRRCSASNSPVAWLLRFICDC